MGVLEAPDDHRKLGLLRPFLRHPARYRASVPRYGIALCREVELERTRREAGVAGDRAAKHTESERKLEDMLTVAQGDAEDLRLQVATSASRAVRESSSA